MNSLARAVVRNPLRLRVVGTAASQSQSLFHSSSLLNVEQYHGTTILCVRKNGKVVMMGDGQVSMGSMMVKPNAKKIRKIGSKEGTGTMVGFAGSTADAFTLVERLETKLEEHPGQLARSCVELAKGWRTDKYLRRLEASLLVADAHVSLELTGNGDVLESSDGVLGVGSGSAYALGKLTYCIVLWALYYVSCMHILAYIILAN